MRTRTVLAAATITTGVAVLGAGPATSAAPGSCGRATITELATAKDPEGVGFALKNGGAVVSTCRDLNGDGRKDALFTVESGGTGGAFFGGIVSDSGYGPELRTWVVGHQKTSFGFRGGRPAFAWPVYRKNEPSCCASGGWKVRRFVPDGPGFKPLKTQRLKAKAYPLKSKP